MRTDIKAATCTYAFIIQKIWTFCVVKFRHSGYTAQYKLDTQSYILSVRIRLLNNAVDFISSIVEIKTKRSFE